MKHTLILAAFIFASTAFAQTQDTTIDDLETIGLNLETSHAVTVTINYPGYRLGGGNPPGKEITDCLMVDIKDSDEDVTVAKKLELAKRLIVEDGFRHDEEAEQSKLVPIVKGENVVFRLISNSAYLTHIRVNTKNGKSLQSNIEQVLKRDYVPVGLVYVRACRF